MKIEELEEKRQKIYMTENPIKLNPQQFYWYLDFLGYNDEKKKATHKTWFRGHRVIKKDD